MCYCSRAKRVFSRGLCTFWKSTINTAHHHFALKKTKRKKINILKAGIHTQKHTGQNILTIFSTKTSVKTLMVYQLALGAFCSMKQQFFVASFGSLYVHLLFFNSVYPIKCGILDSFYLDDSLGARLTKLVTDFLIFLSILQRI